MTDATTFLHRRDMLRLLSAGLGVAALPATALPFVAVAPDSRLTSACVLGRAVLASGQGPHTRAGLTAALHQSLPGVSSDALLGPALKTATQRDFAQGHIVAIDGLVLARVEAHAFAMLAVMHAEGEV